MLAATAFEEECELRLRDLLNRDDRLCILIYLPLSLIEKKNDTPAPYIMLCLLSLSIETEGGNHQRKIC